MNYDFRTLEKKWQQKWAENGLYRTEKSSDQQKYYALTMFPYPSGDLHIGHWYAMVPSDTRARYKRMCGLNVLFPMGFDAFGLPAENAAIKHNIHPYKWTIANIQRMREQLKSMGAMFDWDREVITCDPGYYKWNQWLFCQFFKSGLAYKKHSPVDWCPQCNTTLAREQVVGEDKTCERCDTPVIKRELNQWYLKITTYADELLDFTGLDWPERVKTMQTNWIGRSEGVEFSLQIKNSDQTFPVFTTRIDTLFGVSFIVLAPEHPLVQEITPDSRRQAVQDYIARATRQTEIERLSTVKEKDGIFTGAYALHPLTQAEIPIYIADYVLMSYGTGSIMAVPGHDQRDYEFARKYNLPIPQVIQGDQEHPEQSAYTGSGKLINSGEYDGLDNQEAIVRLTEHLEQLGIGRAKINFRLRDWLVSRQRYWGTPIPIVNCPDCGYVAVPENQLPVLLPEDAEFRPTGESPLLSHESFLNTTCPTCSGPAQRETDTMDTFFDSSWYQYRYISPKNQSAAFDPREVEYWLPVDQYTGGIEHATMHLLYVRFFTKVLRDMGLVKFDEPMTSLFNQGIILGEDSEKMSKSRGNVVSPDSLVNQYGADVVRTYLMFMAPWELGGPWNSEGIGGISRFLSRVWRLASGEVVPGPTPEEISQRELKRQLNLTIKRVTVDMELFKFNTLLSAIMEFTNLLMKCQGSSVTNTKLWQESLDTLLLLLAPVVPHLTEELWQTRGNQGSIHLQAWPKHDEAALVQDEVTIPVQVNGKLRDTITVINNAPESVAVAAALNSVKIQKSLAGKLISKTVFIENKMLNLVIR